MIIILKNTKCKIWEENNKSALYFSLFFNIWFKNIDEDKLFNKHESKIIVISRKLFDYIQLGNRDNSGRGAMNVFFSFSTPDPFFNITKLPLLTISLRKIFKSFREFRDDIKAAVKTHDLIKAPFRNNVMCVFRPPLLKL